MKQLSIFLENKEGRLSDVLHILAEHTINIISLSLADTSEYGMLRLIVSDPLKGKEILRENGISATLTEVLAVQMPNKAGSLETVLNTLCNAKINIEYMYALSTSEETAALVLKTSEQEEAAELLGQSGAEFFSIA